MSNADDVEMLQDLILAAANEALRRAQEMVNENMSKTDRRPEHTGIGRRAW